MRTTGPSDEDDDYSGPVSKSTFLERLGREREKRQRAESALSELSAQVEQLQAGYRSSLDALKTEAAESVKMIGLRHTEDLQMVDLGVTDDLGRQTIRTAWDRLPKDTRGKSPAEWWSGQVEAQRAHLADPKAATAPEVPKALAAYLPAAPATGDNGAGGQPRGAGGPPGGPAKGAGFSLDDIPTDQGFDAFLSGLRQKSR